MPLLGMGHRSEKDWEGVALSLWRELEQPEPPTNALQLAADCGLRVIAGAPGARRYGDVIEVGAGVRQVRLHGLVAHELGHWALRRAGEPDSEAGASYVGAALMLPRIPFERDLRETAWSLTALQTRHPYCSAEMLARRVVALRTAVATVWDNGRCSGRHRSPWMVHRRQFERLTPFERHLAEEVLERGEPVQAEETAWGYPVFDGQWRRVITLVAGDQPGLRE